MTINWYRLDKRKWSDRAERVLRWCTERNKEGKKQRNLVKIKKSSALHWPNNHKQTRMIIVRKMSLYHQIVKRQT